MPRRAYVASARPVPAFPKSRHTVQVRAGLEQAQAAAEPRGRAFPIGFAADVLAVKTYPIGWGRATDDGGIKMPAD